MNARTYSLAEVAAVYLPADWTDGVRWLSRRLNAGQIAGYRVGRTWRMTDDDVDAFLARRRNPHQDAKPATEPATPSRPTGPVSILDGLSDRSRRRVVRAG